MSTLVPDAPTFADLMDAEGHGLETGRTFDQIWVAWLLAQNRAVQDLQTSLPVNSQFFSLVAGPGPVNVTCNITMRKAGILLIFGDITQTWVTAAPSWSVAISVDGTGVYTTGTISNTWQNVVAPQFAQSLAAGSHSVVMTWTAGSANAALAAAALSLIPVYTS